MANDKQPTKYDAAVAKARGAAPPIDVGDPTGTMESLAVIPAEQGGNAVQMATAADFADIEAQIRSGQLEAAPTLFTLESGMMITARLESEGESEIIDENTRLPKLVVTWILSLIDPATGKLGRRISILGAAQLDRQIRGGAKRGEPASLLGCDVRIVRGGTRKQEGKAKQMTDYFVGRFTAPISRS